MRLTKPFYVLKCKLEEFSESAKGNIAVIFALSLVPLVAAVGAAFDYSKANQLRSGMQSALDNSVLAGVREPSAEAKIALAQKFFQAQVSNLWGTAPTASFTFNPGTGILSGEANGASTTSFTAILGVQSIAVKVTSAAIASGNSSKVCILLADPVQSQSFLVNSGANLVAPDCEIHVHSKAMPAAIFNAGVTLNVKRICVKGDFVIKNGGGSLPLETSCDAVADPFVNALPKVTPGPCNYNNQVFNPGTVTINPGVYCGWTNFNGSGSLTLNPGLYIIKSGGMTFNSSWTVKGEGVTFYLVDQNATITFNGNVNAKLNAPATGTYANILFFEPPGLSNTNLPINGTSGSSFQGLMYLPSRDVIINSVSNVKTEKVTMVFSSLILNAMNWSVESSEKSISVGSGEGGVRLIR